MKAVYITEPGKLEIADVPDPVMKNPDDVLIRISYGSICGSDIGIYKGTNSLATYPRIIGHEYGGQVVKTNSSAGTLKPGDWVAVDPVRSCGHCYACRNGRQNVCDTLEVTGVHRDGGFAEYVVSPADRVHRIDIGKIGKELISLVEPYSIGVQVNHRGRIVKNDRVLVMGCGPIGMCIMQDAKARGARVMITDILDARLEEAARMGADKTVNVAREPLADSVAAFTNGEGMPVIADSVCSVSSFPEAVELASPAGRVVVLGLINTPSQVAQVGITKKELEVIGSRLSNRRFPEVIESMEHGFYTPERLVTHSFHFTEAQKAFELVLGNPGEVRKVVLTFA